MDNSNKKKSKINKLFVLYYKKLTFLLNQLDFLLKNKFILQEFYIEKMYLLNEIQNKIKNLESFTDKKKINKNIIDNLNKDINESLEKICNKIGSTNCKNTLDIYLLNENFLDEQNNEFRLLFQFIFIHCF